MKKILMIGPGRDVRGGISTVVNSYYELGIEKDAEIKYIPTMEDGSQIKKLVVAVKAYMEFCRCVKKYDIVHVHMAAQASFVRKSLFVQRAKKAGVKVIIHSHAADFDKYFFEESDDKNRKKIKETFALADKVIVLSEEWADFFGKNVCDPAKIKIIYNGVILPPKNKTSYDDHNILMLGRLGERKGTYDLLKAIPMVLREVPDAMFYLGGDGDIEGCKAIAANEGIQDHIKFLGWIKGTEKKNLLDKCSVFTLPSYYEGMPMSVLEAMSYGLATVSTNAGGIPQIIDDGVDGFRVEAGDIEELSKRFISLLKNPELKKSIGEKAVDKIKNKFDVRVSYKKLLHIYREV